MNQSRGSWRLAARLARREVRRRPLRAVLVLLLIAAPVFALTVADVLVETNQTHAAAERFHRDYGEADLVYELDGRTTARFQPRLPSGSRVATVFKATLPLTPSHGSGLRLVDVRRIDAQGRLDAAGVQLTNGRAPRPGEAVVSQKVADWFRVGIGSELTLTQPEFSARVVGFVRAANDFGVPVLAAPDFPFAVVRSGVVRTDTVVDLPEGYSVTDPWAGGPTGPLPAVAPESQVGDPTLSEPNRDTMQTPTGSRPLPRAFPADAVPSGSFGTVVPDQYGSDKGIAALAKFWSWVAAALLLAMVSVLIAAAFATTARRQLVTLGQLSANGGDQQFLRRMLTMQGTILGVVGTGFGMGLALVALFVWRGWIESLYRHELDYLLTGDLAIIGLTAVVAATIAARFPARSTSRVPVLAALAGRRPLPPVPPLQWVKAVIVFGAGVGLLALVAVNANGGGVNANLAASVAIAGGLFVIAGVAYLTPVAVTLLAKAVGGVGAAARIGARGLVRVRSRSAAIVTAVAIAGTIAIAIVTAMLGFGVNRQIGRFTTDRAIARNQVLLEDVGAHGLPPAADQPVASAGDFTAKQAEVVNVIPRIRFRPVQGFAAVPIVDQSGSAVDIQNRIDGLPGSVLVAIDSPAVQRIVHLTPRGLALLDRDGVVANGTSFALSSGYRSADVQLRVGADVSFAASMVPGSLTSIGAVMTSARARELGIATAVVAVIGTAPSPLTNDQRRALQGDVADPYVAAPAVTDPGAGTIQVQSGFDSAGSAFWRGFWTPDNLQRWFAIGALLFVLVVVAIGLLLGASEGRDENDVLEQLGVRPRTGRRMEATKAALLAFGGGVLALPAGFIPLAVVFGAVQKPIDLVRTASGWSHRGIMYPEIVFPWITAIGIVVIIPLVAALGAWVASAIAQRAHAFRGTLAFDAD